MTANELVKHIAETAKVTQIDAKATLDAILKDVTDAVNRGDSVTLVGFGTFQVKYRAAREGRNPKTGETIQIAAAKVPSFKAGKGLKDAVNG